MNQRLKFHVTRHFALRLAERGLSAECVKNVVHYATDVRHLRTGQNGGKVAMYRKAVEAKTLAVVAEIRNGNCWLLTAYYEN